MPAFRARGTSILRTLLAGTAGGLLLLFCSGILAQTFIEEAASRGLVYSTPYGSTPYAYGSGVSMVDLDDDGDLDIALVGSATGTIGIFENTGTGQFIDRSSTSGIPPAFELSGICAADYDADGDLDLYVTAWVGPNLLLRNEGGFQFSEVAAAAGVDDPNTGTGSCWGDFDGDGYADLYLVNRNSLIGALPVATENRLYLNQQNGTFIDVAPQQGVDNPHAGLQAVFLDFDRDGDLDLYLSNDRGDFLPDAGNRLFRNDDGQFVDVSVVSGTYLQIDSMGLAVGDLDRNGFLDIYATNTPAGNPLLMNQGDGTFLDLATTYGVSANWLGWGTHFLDLDHDADLDLFVANWYGRNFVFLHDGGLPFVEIGLSAGFADSDPTLCTAVGDIDLDGDLDLLVQNFQMPTQLHVHQGTSGNWIVVRLVGDLPNRPAIGATVDIRAGGIAQTQAVISGSSYKSTSSFALHFGLDVATLVDEIDVTWPDGSRTIRRLVPANQHFVIERTPSVTPDCNGNGVPDADDLLAGTSVDSDGDGILDDCEPWFLRGDADGSGARDIADAISSLATVFSGRISLCPDAVDANDDGLVDIADAITLLQHLFAGVAALPEPFADCGVDPTPDAGPPLDCLGAHQNCP